MPGKDTGGEPSPLEYGNAIRAGAAFVFWPRTELGPRIVEEVFPDAILLARFLRDHPEEARWPAGPPPNPAAYRILVVKDDIGALGPPRDLLREMGFQVTFATDGADGLRWFEAERPDVVWMNALRPAPSGPAALAQLCERAKGHVPCLAYAGHGEGWLKRAGPVFRCWLFPGDREYSRTIFHDAIRLRRAYQHSLTPRGHGGPMWPPGAPPSPPPLPP